MSIPLTAGATLHPLVLPARADAADAGEFRELSRVRNLIYREITGRDENDLDPEALLPAMRSQKELTRLLWVVRLGDEIVGRVLVDIPREEGSRVATAAIELRPHAWGQGVGGAVLPRIEAVALEHGRTVLQGWAKQPASAGARIQAPTGFGSVPRDHTARFLIRHGFGLEQVYRVSHLPLSTAAFERAESLLAEARAAATDYRILQWTAPSPDDRIDDYAWLKSRMSTDAPSADLEVNEERWDADRLRTDERRTAEMRWKRLVTVAEHIPTGRLSAFTELAIGPDGAATTHQEDTLVLREHRGHRLGMLLKCAALLAWRDIAPDSPAVVTYNAEENRPMLSVNEAMGFTATAYEGAWKKELT